MTACSESRAKGWCANAEDEACLSGAVPAGGAGVGPCGRSIPDVAASLGVSAQSLRNRKRQDDRDRGERQDGLTSVERDELKQLRKRVKRLEQEGDILKRATALFARETER
ncbi:MAG: transposase [Solirubrobacteraceae bacterium]